MNRKERRARLGERDRSREGGDQARGVTPGERLDRNQLADLREQRAEAYNAMTAVLDAAEREGRDLSHNQVNEYDRHEADFDRLDARIKGAEARNQRDLDGADTRGTVAISGEPERRERRTLTLGREQRMVDWCAERGDSSRYSADDAEEFSAGRAIRGMVTGQWQDADLERRALAEGADSTGGAIVPSLLSAQTIDRIRNAARVLEAGGQAVPMGAESVSFPKLTGAVTPAWRAENDPVAESDPAFSKVELKAKTLAVVVKLSYELVEDAISPQGSDLITNELVSALALELDSKALYGDGTGNAPTGIKSTAGVTVEAIAADGATPTSYAPFLTGAFALRRGNVQPSAFVYSERTAEVMAGLTANDGQPLRPPPAIESVQHLPSNQVPDDLDQGTTLDAASDLFTGDFARLLVGFRPTVGFRVLTDNQSFMASNMQVAILAWVRADVAVAHTQGFHVLTGLLG